MNRRIISSLYKKEMLDVIRDKKTIIVMIVVPLILYPLLFVVGIQFIASITKEISTSTYTVAFEDDIDTALIELFAETGDSTYNFRLVRTENCEKALFAEQIDAYIGKEDISGKTEYVIHYLSAVSNSSYAADYCSDTLKKYSSSITISKLEEVGLNPEEILTPIDIKYMDMASSEESAGNLLGTILPYMLIISLLLGTVYPAIDATAGERERGTLETVLTLPITNRQLIVSKFLAVSTLGIITAILNVISMGFVCGYMIKMMGSYGVDMSVNMTRFIPAMLVGILCIIAFAVFMSAVTMCVCAFAKTYKEANNYITPLTLIVMFASFVAFIPSMELTERMALVPVANICLLIKNILVFKFDIGIIAIVLISNIAYGIVAVMLLGRIYNSESILFGDGSAATQIFEKRSNMLAGGCPSMGDAWLVMAITAVIIIYIGGSAQLEYGIAGVLFTQLIILAIPMLISWYTRKSIKKTFRIKSCSLLQIFSAIIIIAGAILLGIVMTACTSAIFPGSADNVEVSMDSLIGDTFIVTLLVVALAPAICEEMMFRGYILSAMESKLKPISAIFMAAAFFGIYHMSVVKFFTTGLLGVFICYVAHKTKSIVPGMLMHFINNGLACVLMYYPEKIETVLPFLTKENYSLSDMLIILAAGLVLVVIGMKLLDRLTNDKIITE